MKAVVRIRPKDGVLDPQGEAVRGALSNLGFAVAGARVGRLVELDVATQEPETARAEVERMCEQLLANPLIESYDVDVR